MVRKKKPISTIPPPPHELSAAAKKLWATIHSGWALDDSARVLLLIYLQASDRATTARALITQEGMVISTAKSTRVHPAVAVARDAETTMLRAWRQLGLDVSAPGPVGRPAGRGPA